MNNDFLQLVNSLTDEYFLTNRKLIIEFDSYMNYMITLRQTSINIDNITRLVTLSAKFGYSCGVHRVSISDAEFTDIILFKDI